MEARPSAMRPLLLALPAALLVLLTAAGVTAGSRSAPVCEAPKDCVAECRNEAKELRAACRETGAPNKACKRRAAAYVDACLDARCAPGGHCEGRCRIRASQLLRRCLAAGHELERCRTEAAEALEVCRERCPEPCVCPDVYAPVCGVDGQTHGNACEARCAGTEIAHRGPCRPRCEPLACDLACPEGFAKGPDGCEICRCAEPCICAQVYLPVCGVDGETHGNGCEARCAGVEIAHPGPCRAACRSNADCPDRLVCYPPRQTCQPPCAVDCLVYDPVCGEDDRTYGCGEADAHCHGVEVAHEGECDR